MSETAVGVPNAEQIEAWNNDAGRQWVTEQERFRRMLAPITGDLMSALSARPGERIIDVGCGFGDTTLAAARAAGPDGFVLGVDLSGPMLELARERAGAEGLSNIRFEQSDAQTHAFEAASFDAVTSRFGVMFFDDPVAAFSNMGRALRPEGRMAFVCWQEPTANEWIMLLAAAVAQHVPLPAPDPGAPGPFAFGDDDRVRSILTEAGFADVNVTPVRTTMRLASDPDDLITFFDGSDLAKRLLGDAPPDKAEAVKASLREAASGVVGDDGIVLGGSAWLVTASRS